MSIGVVTVASDLYAENLPAWAESVRALNTQPDQIVIACQTVPVDLDLDCTIVLIPADEPWDFATWWNRAIAACDTDWVAWCGVDDTYRPHAMDSIERNDADVVGLGFQYDTGQTWIPQADNAAIRAVEGNLIPCGSPFRKSLWQRMPIPQGFGPLADWAFWVGLAFINARFASTGRIDVDYSFAGHINPPIEPTRTQIRDWVQSL